MINSIIKAESKKFRIESYYETVILINKINGVEVDIGDFYGDVECAIIDRNEKFCVMGGCGLIIYFLKEPFETYFYNNITTQYKEFWRSGELNGKIWVKDIKQIDDENVLLDIEDNIKNYSIIINVYEK